MKENTNLFRPNGIASWYFSERLKGAGLFVGEFGKYCVIKDFKKGPEDGFSFARNFINDDSWSVLNEPLVLGVPRIPIFGWPPGRFRSLS